MILATHALAGAAIGKNFQNPWIIILLSLIVHFGMDALRHGEYFDSRVATVRDSAWKVALDLFFGGLVIFLYINLEHADISQTKNMFLGAFFSMFPDLLTLLFWKFKWKSLSYIKKVHELSHRYNRYPAFSPERQWTIRNATNDILISVLAIIILFF